VIPPSSVEVRLDIISIDSPSGSVPTGEFGTYLSLSSPVAPYGEKGAAFLLSSSDKLSTITLKPTLSLLLPDSTRIEIVWEPLKIRVTDEFLDMTPRIGEKIISTVDTTESLPVEISLTPKKGSSEEVLSQSNPYTLDIYDDVNNMLIESGVTLATSPYRLPDRYKNMIWSYRIIATDRSWRVGETTIAVRSGPVSRMEFIPVSSTLVKWSKSLWVLRLFDARGNLISPTLLDLKATAIWWYLLDASGDEQTSISLSTIDSEFIFSYGTQNAGNMKLTFEIADPRISLSKDITIIERPRIKIIRSVVPKVWGDPIDMQIQIVDAVTDTPLSGFSSIASVDIPSSAWVFSGSELRIIDGQSEPFIFTPGKKSWEHLVSIEIPGISNIAEKKFNVLPWKAMYIDGTIGDTSIDFTLRDRYGNVADSDNLTGTLKKNQDPPGALSFINGTASFPRSSGYWRVDVPSIEANTLTYTDAENTQTSTQVTTTNITKTIKGIPYYNLYVNDIVGKYNFLPDYNARYTVLAGDTYLKEGSQILYDTTPGASQSLAVSTLLSTPYSQDTIFSIFPGWWWTSSDPSDMAIETTLSARWAFLKLEISDSASASPIGQVGYPVLNLPLSTCTESGSSTNLCSLPGGDEGIVFTLFPESDYRTEKWGSSMSIVENTEAIMSYTQERWLALSPGISLIPRKEYSAWHLTADIEYLGEVIGRMLVGTRESGGVDVGLTTSPVSKLTLDSWNAYSRQDAYSSVFREGSRGYSIYREASDITLEERILWPSHIENLWSLRESPWVGWQGNNKSLLSFAAWDSLGEATRWFHSYTLVNLWDPVAHVDIGAPGTSLEGIDRSIGTQIAGSSERSIESYKVRDMNADWLDDAIVVYSDGFLEMYMNLGWVFRKKQKIAYLPDITSRW
jgi:hypothetical protein